MKKISIFLVLLLLSCVPHLYADRGLIALKPDVRISSPISGP